LKSFLLNQSLAVRTFVLPEVKSLISTINPTYDYVCPYKTNIIDWLKPIIDLSEFCVYPTNGITEGLNWWYNREIRSVYLDQGEYQWIAPKSNNSDAIKYQSIPSSSDGNFCDITDNKPVALDLAYIGSTQVKKIHISKNVEYVFYSLSKSFGVSNIRTGWFFSRVQDKKLESITYDAKYYNYFAHACAESIINNFDIDYVYKKLSYKQTKICNDLDLIPSDSVWIATTTNQEYAKFRRKNNIARICLSGVMNEEKRFT
jgi:hypothetical protein